MRDPEPSSSSSSSLAARLHLESVKARVFGRAPGARLDRYVVLGKLGEGGTGTVFAAFDPTLDRKVAIKLLSHAAAELPTGASDPRSTPHEALEREARAMARLSHPHVVHVYEVGEREGQRYLVMELVQGSTLRERQREIREGARSARAILELVELYAQAGRGLAAAHRVGLVHRDFKPENVLIDDEGRAKVCDFGLARGFEGEAGSTLPEVLAGSVDARTTIVGTPAYMAPEQLRGEFATERSDQFSFCVALYEALQGERPFAGKTPPELFANVLEGKRHVPAEERAVPSWLRRAYERGLSLDPQQRWPSMDALLETLARGRTRARLRKGLAAVGVVAVLAAAGQGARSYQLAQRVAACEASGDEIESAWNEEREQALREAMVDTGVSFAATTADNTVPWLERQASAWRVARVETCMDATVHERWDAQMIERSLWCLDERRVELGSLVEVLTQADPTGLQKAVSAAAGLESVSRCRDALVLGSVGLPPLEDREAIARVRGEVSRAGSLEQAGLHAEGLVQAREALERAEALHWRPLTAAARQRLGSLLARTGAHAQAETLLEDAYFEGGEGGAPELLFDAATVLVYVVGEQAREADARRWGRHAELALAAIGDGQLARARLLGELALIDADAGAYDEAAAGLARALAIEEGVLGPEHPHVAITLSRLASVRRATAAYDEARGLLERALAIEEEALGPEHPRVAVTLAGLGNVYYRTGANDQAVALYRRALAISEAGLGPENADVARLLGNLANVYRTTGDYAAAAAALERALVIFEAALGPEHPDVAACLDNLGAVYQMDGRVQRATALHERALAIKEKVLGPEHPSVAVSLINLANAFDAMGDRDRAVSMYERALVITEAALGPEHPEVATALNNLAEVYTAAGAYDEAKALHERAFAIWEKVQGPGNPDIAYSLLGLAEVALGQGRPRDAVSLARRAVALREQARVSTDLLAEARSVLDRALAQAPPGSGR